MFLHTNKYKEHKIEKTVSSKTSYEMLNVNTDVEYIYMCANAYCVASTG